MSGFLLSGVLAGAILVAVHLWFSATAMRPPLLSEGVESIVLGIGWGIGWGIGVAGGIKVCKFALTGELAAAFKTTTPIGEEDLVYFLLVGFAPIWISFDSIVRLDC